MGRSKEGFSLNKVMIGYAGWGIERAPISDATLPILADGVKWLGVRSQGAHPVDAGRGTGDAVSEGQSFSTYESQISRPVRLGAGIVGERQDAGAPGRQSTVRQGQQRDAQASRAPRRVGGAVRPGHRRVCRQQHEDDGVRSLLPARPLHVRIGVFLQARQCPGFRRSVVSGRRRGGDVDDHRRNPLLQHPRRLLQSDLAEPARVRGRAGRMGKS